MTYWDQVARHSYSSLVDNEEVSPRSSESRSELLHFGWSRLDARLAQAQIADPSRSTGICRVCGQTASEVDHIRPVIDGGTNHPNNLRSLCHGCHAGA